LLRPAAASLPMCGYLAARAGRVKRPCPSSANFCAQLFPMAQARRQIGMTRAAWALRRCSWSGALPR